MRLALRAVVPEAVAIGMLTWTLATVVGLGQQVLTSAVVPDPDPDPGEGQVGPGVTPLLLGPYVGEQPGGWVGVRQAPVVFVVGAFEEADRSGLGHEDGQVVVCVVAPPHPGGGVLAEVFPGAPQGFEAAHGLVVAPPLGGPVRSAGVDLAPVDLA